MADKYSDWFRNIRQSATTDILKRLTKISAELEKHFDNDLELLSKLNEKAGYYCESPIETMLFNALMKSELKLKKWGNVTPIAVRSKSDIRRVKSRILTNLKFVFVIPQARIGKYRVDFLIRFGTLTSLSTKSLVLECDGKQYHEVPEKFTSDRVRDRFLQTYKMPVLRFTGREINDDVNICVEAIKKYIYNNS